MEEDGRSCTKRRKMLKDVDSIALRVYEGKRRWNTCPSSISYFFPCLFFFSFFFLRGGCCRFSSSPTVPEHRKEKKKRKKKDSVCSVYSTSPLPNGRVRQTRVGAGPSLLFFFFFWVGNSFCKKSFDMSSS